MSLKIIKTTRLPSCRSTFIQMIKGFMPKKIAQSHFSIREITADYVKAVWKFSSNTSPLLKLGLNIEKIKANYCKCEWIYKKEEDKKIIVFYLHGGAYLGGTLSEARHDSIRYLFHTGCALFVANYRVSAIGPFPFALNDAIDGYRAMLSLANHDSRIIVIGDSAGGGLAMAMVKRLLEKKMKLPEKIILNSPWVDLTCSGKSYDAKKYNDVVLHEHFLKTCALYYAGEIELLDNPYVSPLFADLTGFPPISIHVGTNEILLSDSLRLAKKASLCNVNVKLKIWKSMFHMFHCYEGVIPESTQACEDIYNEILK